MGCGIWHSSFLRGIFILSHYGKSMLAFTQRSMIKKKCLFLIRSNYLESIKVQTKFFWILIRIANCAFFLFMKAFIIHFLEGVKILWLPLLILIAFINPEIHHIHYNWSYHWTKNSKVVDNHKPKNVRPSVGIFWQKLKKKIKLKITKNHVYIYS